MHVNPSAWPFGPPRVLAPTTSTGTRMSSRPPSAANSSTRSARTDRASSIRPISSPTSTSGTSSSFTSTTSGSSSQSSSPSSLLSTSSGTSTRPSFTGRLSTLTPSSRLRTTLGAPSASQTGSSQNATQQMNNLPYSAIYIGLLGLLLIIVLGVLFYARKAARRNRSSSFTSSEYSVRDEDVEKAPFTTGAPYQQRNSYAPGDFLDVNIDDPHEPARPPSRQYPVSVEDPSGEQQRSFWTRVFNLARSHSPALMGSGRRRDLEQGSDDGRDQDVSRVSLLPPAITAEPSTPSKNRRTTGTKESKSPKHHRRQSRAFGEASALEQGHSSYGGLAGTISPDRLNHLMSLASAKIPPLVRTTPLPLRKRHVTREAVSAPIVTTPIYPGEMMRRPSTALIPVEIARARVAAAKAKAARPQLSSEEGSVTGRPSPPPQASLDVIAEVDQELDSQEEQRETNLQEDSLEEEEDSDQQPSPNAPSTKISRSTSVLRPVSLTPSRPDARSEDKAQAENPFPWDAAPSRVIDAPLANEIRRNLLSGRPVLRTSRSHDETTRRQSSLAAHVSQPTLKEQSLTSPGDERKAQSQIGNIDLFPLKVWGFPWKPNEPPPSERVSDQDLSPGSSWEGSRRSSGLMAAVTSLGSRRALEYATLWSGSNVDPPPFHLEALSTGPHAHEGTQNQRMLQELREEEAEGQEQPAELQNQHLDSRRFSIIQEDPMKRRPSAWSGSSTYSQEPSAPVVGRHFAGERSAISPSVEPLKLPTNRSPAPPRPSPVGQRLASEGIAQTEPFRPPSEEFTIKASPARSARDSPPSPTAKNFERKRMESIASGIMEFFGQHPTTPDPASSTSSRRPAENGREWTSGQSLRVPSTTPAKSSPGSPFRLQLEQSRTPERMPTPRTATTPSVLPDLAHFRGRTTVTPAAISTAASPCIRFSDAVEVISEDTGVLSPPPRSVRLLTTPSLAARYTENIISPQPVPRCGSLIPRLPSATPNTAARLPEVSAIREPTAGPSGTTGTPPKAVQTREMWREIRRTSATAYYLGAMEAERGHEDEGESSLR